MYDDSIPKAPWDDCMFTHIWLVDFCGKLVGKYSIHGSYKYRVHIHPQIFFLKIFLFLGHSLWMSHSVSILWTLLTRPWEFATSQHCPTHGCIQCVGEEKQYDTIWTYESCCTPGSTNIARKGTLNEDVFPIENGLNFRCYVSLLEHMCFYSRWFWRRIVVWESYCQIVIAFISKTTHSKYILYTFR